MTSTIVNLVMLGTANLHSKVPSLLQAFHLRANAKANANACQCPSISGFPSLKAHRPGKPLLVGYFLEVGRDFFVIVSKLSAGGAVLGCLQGFVIRC